MSSELAAKVAEENLVVARNLASVRQKAGVLVEEGLPPVLVTLWLYTQTDRCPTAS